MMKYWLWPVFGVALVIASCSGERKQEAAAESRPPLIEYIASIDYADTAALHTKTVMENHLAGIVKLLPVTDAQDRQEALTIFFKGIRSDEEAMGSAFHFADLFLANPASPARDYEQYIGLLDALLSVDSIPPFIKSLAQERLRVASLNSPGSIASDFTYEDRNGCRGNLHDSSGKYTLLIFFDPECSHCSDILRSIAEHPGLNAAIEAGIINVLAVYAEGKDDIWQKNCRKMPNAWTVARDRSNILENSIYDLPAMPTLYLLDRDKRVMLKDPNVNVVLRLFEF